MTEPGIKENNTPAPVAAPTNVHLDGPLKWLCLAALPLGYFVSLVPGRYGTHAVFGMMALLIVVSLTTSVKQGRYTGLILAMIWGCVGVIFYNSRGI